MRSSLLLAALLTMAAWSTPRAESPVSVRLVSAKSQLEGSLVSSHAVYADRECIYLASSQGKLFVLARQRTTDFPLLQVIQDTAAPLTAVHGDRRALYVASADGVLRIYRKGAPLVRVGALSLSSFGLSAVAVHGANVYVATGQAQVAVGRAAVYFTALNEGEVGIRLAKETLAPMMSYGQTFTPYTTVVFHQRTGARVGSVPTPFDVWGHPAQPNLYVSGALLAQTVPGCCGAGIFLYDAGSLQLQQFIPRRFTNTVTRSGRWLIAGNEGGQVDVFDLSRTPSPLVSTIDLRAVTGHTGSEDIEIRALWTDGSDNLIFAGSSWGNEQSRRPSLPSFFVLELTPTP